ncbi:MAG: AAA family ATPase [Myxococcota bacterium]
MNFERVAVVGTSGAGKSTFARRLAERTGSTYVELDSLFWNPGWKTTGTEEFSNRVAAAVSQESWVIDGNYAAVRPQIWARASCLVWLNYPFRITFARLVRRTLQRTLSGEKCCNGNREELSKALFSRDSVLLWAITSHPMYKKEYPREIEAYPHLDIAEIRDPKEAEQLLLKLGHGE